MRVYHQNKKPIYQIDDWKVIEDGFNPEYNHRSETIFALGNGYIGLRGTFEEDYTGNENFPTTPGTYINGVYDSEKIQYGEFVYGMPEYSQTMMNLADWKIIRVKIGDEWLDISKDKLKSFQRVLDLKKGILSRTMIWQSTEGKELKVRVVRCLSLKNPHQAVIHYEITPLNFSDKITISTEIKGDVENYHFKLAKKLQVLKNEIKDDGGYVVQKTNKSDITVVFAMENELVGPQKELGYERKEISDDKNIGIQYTWYGKAGERYYLNKYVSFYTELDLNKEENSEIVEKLVKTCLNEVLRAKARGFSGILEEQEEFLKDYWNDVDVQIEGDSTLQQGVRFNAFHLLQSCGRNGKTSIGAKGLTGEYYEGHYFWDTEIYIDPFFLYSRPEIVKDLLMYRYNTLDQARARARVLRNKGALYAWRTINGHEASALFEGSTAQYHINAAIVYALNKYVEVTGDIDFLINYGAEIIFETSRLWADRGGFVKLKGNKFCINEVCGPDEYKSGVNNNCYTNYMARFNLQLGVKVARMMEEQYPEKYQKLAQKINLKAEEIKYWEHCANEMYLPFNEELGIHPQDDSFLYKEEIDVDSIPLEQIPLVRNWHPLNIWRYQLCKQADVVLLMFLQGNLFDLNVKKANYDYYEPRTTHDSSLSSCIFSIIASEIGYYKDAYNYFMQTARLDLDDYNNNTHEGIHAACMAGSWLCVTHGFAGMRVYNGELHFKPYLPDSWKSYHFKVRFRNRILQIRVDDQGVKYTLLKGEKLEFFHNEKKVSVERNQTLEVSNK